VDKDRYFDGGMFAEYVRWRKKNPSDDLITELLSVEFEDHSGMVRNLTTGELLIFLAVIAGAGVETTGRLFGWMGKVLAEHPDQQRELAADDSLVSGAIEELLRFEPPGPHVARYVATADVEFHGHTVPQGSGKRAAPHARLGEPRRAPLPPPRPLRHSPQARWSLDIRARSSLLPGRPASSAGGPHSTGGGTQTIPQVGRRPRQRTPVPHVDRPRLGQHARDHWLTLL
jgi:cytochrome P450